MSVDERSEQPLATQVAGRDPLQAVLRYHEATKHRFSRYARGPGRLDWSNQPDPFRRYEGTSLFALPLPKPGEPRASPTYGQLYQPGAIASSPVNVRSLARLFEYSLAISAWKQAGGVCWALRTNPSSGNLHPTEAYLLVGGVAGLSTSPGLYHYAARQHALELRARWPEDSFARLLEGFPRGAFLLGLASVIWREAWKYGERAFRYCQHDVGHAIGSVRIAARTLGWRMVLLDGLADDELADLMGIDRAADFKDAEREHPDCLAVIWPGDTTTGAETAVANCRLPLSLGVAGAGGTAQRIWSGKANRLSRDQPVRWEMIDEVVAATWKSGTKQDAFGETDGRRASEAVGGGASHCLGPPSAGRVIRQRRSALAFDGTTSIPRSTFFAMLTRVMPGGERGPCERAMPWDVLPWNAAIDLALFVHRVDGLVPGLYLLARDPARVPALRRATHPHFDWTSAPGCPDGLLLFLLQAGDARALAAELSCRQDIGGTGALSLGMIAEFEPSLRRHGSWFYRRLFWETGLIGQVLYLEAEAAGVRATGIGCFFDDPVHEVLGFRDARFQSLYHFTIGGPVDDARLTTVPPYDRVARRLARRQSRSLR